MEIRRIVPDISSDQIDKSKQFYQEFRGLKLAMDREWILTFVSESNPTAQITIVKTENLQISNSNIMITMEVADVNQAYERAIALGYEINYPLTNEQWGVKRFFVKDPNGVTINLMCHIK
jgi:predicted enzyme related to lactoylglutathione lyase